MNCPCLISSVTTNTSQFRGSAIFSDQLPNADASNSFTHPAAKHANCLSLSLFVILFSTRLHRSSVQRFCVFKHRFLTVLRQRIRILLLYKLIFDYNLRTGYLEYSIATSRPTLIIKTKHNGLKLLIWM